MVSFKPPRHFPLYYAAVGLKTAHKDQFRNFLGDGIITEGGLIIKKDWAGYLNEV